MEDARLRQGGEVAKFNDNVAAVQILQRLAAERRRVTLDGQRELASARSTTTDAHYTNRMVVQRMARRSSSAPSSTG